MCGIKKEKVKPSLCAFELSEKQLIEAFRYLENSKLPGNTQEAQEYNEILIENLNGINFLRSLLLEAKRKYSPQEART